MENAFHGANCLIDTSIRQVRFFISLLRIVKALPKQHQPYQFFAFGLSLTAHLGLGFILTQGGEWTQGKSLRPKPSSIMVDVINANSTGFVLLPLGNNLNYTTTSTQEVTRNSASSAWRETPAMAIYRPAEAHYFRSKDLTEKPLVLRDIPPDIGYFLPDVKSQIAVVRLLINEYGEIDQVILEGSELPKFAQNLLANVFSEVKFRPGKIDGVAVKSQLKIEVAIESAATVPLEARRSLPQ